MGNCFHKAPHDSRGLVGGHIDVAQEQQGLGGIKLQEPNVIPAADGTDHKGLPCPAEQPLDTISYQNLEPYYKHVPTGKAREAYLKAHDRKAQSLDISHINLRPHAHMPSNRMSLDVKPPYPIISQVPSGRTSLGGWAPAVLTPSAATGFIFGDPAARTRSNFNEGSPGQGLSIKSKRTTDAVDKTHDPATATPAIADSPTTHDSSSTSMQSLQISQAPAGSEVDNVLTLICSMFQVPVAAVASLQSRVIFLKQSTPVADASSASSADDTWRMSLCSWAFQHSLNDVLVVDDVSTDARLKDAYCAQTPPMVHFYCAAPLKSSTGEELGAVCFVDFKPRSMSTANLAMLHSLTPLLVSQLERDMALLAERSSTWQTVEEMGEQYIKTLDNLGKCIMFVDISSDGWPIIYANTAWTKLSGGMSREQTVGRHLWEMIVPQPGTQLDWCSCSQHVSEGQQFELPKVAVKEQPHCQLTLKFRPAARRSFTEDILPGGLPHFIQMGTGASSCYLVILEDAAPQASEHSSRQPVASASYLTLARNVAKIDGLELFQRLGQGAFGSVYAGMWWGRPVAVKIIDNKCLGKTNTEGMSLEALMGQELDHPNIVKTLACLQRHAVDTSQVLMNSMPQISLSPSTQDTSRGASSTRPALVHSPLLGQGRVQDHTSRNLSDFTDDTAQHRPSTESAQNNIAKHSAGPASMTSSRPSHSPTPHRLSNLSPNIANGGSSTTALDVGFCSPYASLGGPGDVLLPVLESPSRPHSREPASKGAYERQPSSSAASVWQWVGQSSAMSRRAAAVSNPLLSGAILSTQSTGGALPMGGGSMGLTEGALPLGPDPDNFSIFSNVISGNNALMYNINDEQGHLLSDMLDGVAGSQFQNLGKPGGVGGSGNDGGKNSSTNSEFDAGETWLIMEYCDRGTLQDALEHGLFCLPSATPMSPHVSRGSSNSQSIKLAAGAAAGSSHASHAGHESQAPSDGGNSSGEVNLSAVLDTAIEIASALQYLHSCGIIHGDLTAWNVMLTSASGSSSTSTVTGSTTTAFAARSSSLPAASTASRTSVSMPNSATKLCSAGERGFIAKVADFGLSRMMDAMQSKIRTRTYGTITHMPPEVLISGIVSKAADVFSLGVLLWQLYTGRKPWAGMNHGQILYNVGMKNQQLEFPAGTPAALQALAWECTAADPAARPGLSSVIERLKDLKVQVQLNAADLPVLKPSRQHSNSASHDRRTASLPTGV